MMIMNKKILDNYNKLILILGWIDMINRIDLLNKIDIINKTDILNKIDILNRINIINLFRININKEKYLEQINHPNRVITMRFMMMTYSIK